MTIAVEPFLDGEPAKRTFSLDLPDAGVVPIYVVVENTGGGIVRVQKSNVQFELNGRPEQHYGRVGRKLDAHRAGIGARQAVGLGLGYLAGAVGSAVMYPGLAALGVPEDLRIEASARMTNFELPDRSLWRKQSAYGFVYLAAGRDAMSSGNPLIHPEIPRLSPSGEPIEVSFPLNDAAGL